MKLVKMFWLAALILCSASLALADGIDPRVVPDRGPTGSPTFVSSFDLLGSADFTVVSGTVTAMSITLPTADLGSFQLTCGISNAFLDAPGTVLHDSMGFYTAPVTTSAGETCNYTTSTAAAEAGESVSKAESDCLATNLGSMRDADDCAGIPSGTTNSDVVFTVLTVGGGVPEGGIHVASVITPEPASLSLLLVGMAGLFMYRRRRLA